MLKTPRPELITYREAQESCAGPVDSARLHGRAMNKIVVIQPACRAMVQGSAGLPPGQRVKRRLQMHLSFPVPNPSGTDQPGSRGSLLRHHEKRSSASS